MEIFEEELAHGDSGSWSCPTSALRKLRQERHDGLSQEAQAPGAMRTFPGPLAGRKKYILLPLLLVS